MRGTRLILLFFLAFMSVGLVTLLADRPATAQGENLLINPGFEGVYNSYVPETAQELADCPLGVCTTAQVPSGWKPWWVKERPTDVNPEFKPAESSAAGNRVHSGSRAAQYFSFWSTHKAGLRQSVTVPANSVVVFSVMGQAWMSESDTSLTSDYSGSSNMRIGIDPTGGTNPYSPSIVWSGYQQAFDAYQPFSVQAQAQGDRVTVFTFSAPSVNPNSPDYGFKHTDIYWDDASLTVAGAGSAPPPPADSGESSANSAPAAVAQYVPGPTPTPDAEGVIYIEVQSGDSLWAISARAGITLDELLELNDINSDHVIRSGDLLIIGFGDAPGSESEQEAENATESADLGELVVESQSSPLPVPSVTPTTAGNTSGDVSGGTICLTVFEDLSKDTELDADEPLLPDVAITISDGEQVVSNYITDGESEPFCIEGLEAGSYRVTRSSLSNESLTTPGDYAVEVQTGTVIDVEFGSVLSDNVLVSAKSSAEQSVSSEGEADTRGEGAIVEESNGLLNGLIIAGIVVGVLLMTGIVVLILSNRRATT